MLQRATAAEIREPHFSNVKAESTPGFETERDKSENGHSWTKQP